ncbi:MAG TPA: hypothetical protein VIO14_01290 [Dehalococcoidia bacterium]
MSGRGQRRRRRAAPGTPPRPRAGAAQDAVFRPDFRLLALYAAFLTAAGAVLLLVLQRAPDTPLNGLVFSLYAVYALLTTANRALTRVAVRSGRLVYDSWFGLQRRVMTLSTVASVQGRVLPALFAGGATMILRRSDGLGIRLNLAFFSRPTLARLLETVLAHSPDARLDPFWTNLLQRARRG